MLALEDIKVLDLAPLAPGALCTMFLGDLGAEVIKIEAPPDARRPGALGISPKDEQARREAAYNPLNRNKKSLGLNLRTEAGRQIFYRLIEKADIIVEGYRPGVVKRLGIDYDTVKNLNPKIIYCSLSGYGQDGPYSNLPGHDINYISFGGALALIGNQDGPPVIPLNLIADFAGASLHGVIGILSALIAREKIGTGQYIDIAYMDTVISLLAFFTPNYFLRGIMPKRGETALHGAYPYYAIYETKDGKYISLGCLEPYFWENLCRALGKEELIPYHFEPDHLWKKPEADWAKITLSLKQLFRTKTRDEWFDFLAKNDVPIAKVYTLDEVFSDPQVTHREMVIEINHPSFGKVSQVGIAIKMSKTPGKVRSLAPLLGEHTEEILLNLGYSKPEIENLRQTGVIV